MTKSEYITMQTNFRVLSRVAACLFADYPDIQEELKNVIWATSTCFEDEYKDALRYVKLEEKNNMDFDDYFDIHCELLFVSECIQTYLKSCPPYRERLLSEVSTLMKQLDHLYCFGDVGNP